MHEFFLDSWALKTGQIGCPETSVRNYQYSLRDNSEERTSQETDIFYIKPYYDIKAHVFWFAPMPPTGLNVTMVTRVWQELEYHIDVCRVTRGAHIEHL